MRKTRPVLLFERPAKPFLKCSGSPRSPSVCLLYKKKSSLRALKNGDVLEMSDDSPSNSLNAISLWCNAVIFAWHSTALPFSQQNKPALSRGAVWHKLCSLSAIVLHQGVTPEYNAPGQEVRQIRSVKQCVHYVGEREREKKKRRKFLPVQAIRQTLTGVSVSPNSSHTATVCDPAVCFGTPCTLPFNVE